MIEVALYVTLGFAVAALIALMLAPAFYRRTVRITRNRIEASVPLTLNEIQADKDQLRAEFAMSTRRLEMNLDKLRERASTQVIEVNRKRDELSKVAEELRERQAELDAARAEGKRLAAELKAREETLAAAEERLATTNASLETRGKQLDDYEAALKAATADVDSHKQELAARDTRLSNLDAAVRTEREQAEVSTAEADRLRADLAAAHAELEQALARSTAQDEALEAGRARIAQLEEMLDGQEDGTARPVSTDDAANREIETLRAQNAHLEADLAQALLRASAMAGTPNRDNADAAADGLRAENERLSGELSRLRTELETQKVELAAAQLAGRDEYESERRENAIVRERLNDLAARVTAMTAEMEGADSTVDRILRETPEPPRFPTGSYDTPDGTPPTSLADRIRALKELAEKE